MTTQRYVPLVEDKAHCSPDKVDAFVAERMFKKKRTGTHLIEILIQPFCSYLGNDGEIRHVSVVKKGSSGDYIVEWSGGSSSRRDFAEWALVELGARRK